VSLCRSDDSATPKPFTILRDRSHHLVRDRLPALPTHVQHVSAERNTVRVNLVGFRESFLDRLAARWTLQDPRSIRNRVVHDHECRAQ
jgi:hypothetical protein